MKREDADPLERFSRDLAPANRRSLSQDVVDRLRASIVRGEFGKGQRLSEAALAEAFGVSRGPIREAFTVLEREGLLEIERHKGARVALLTQVEIDEIYQLRNALEQLAMERALRYATPEDLAEMDAVVDQMAEAVAAGDVPRVVDLDIRFHDLVYRAARQSRLYQAWANLRPQIEFFLHSRAKDTAGYMTIAVAEHRALREVLVNGTKKRALTMIDEHLRGAYEMLSTITT